jgi:tetratricopeptide (TPR) repeat protein
MNRNRMGAVLMALAVVFTTKAFPQSKPPVPMILAGSPEDKALRAVENEPDAAKRVSLLDQFVKDFPAMVQVPDVNEMYVFAYQQLKNNSKVIEYSEKVLVVKPTDIDVLPLAINALLDQPSLLEKAWEYAKRYQKLAQNADSLNAGRTLSEQDRTRIQADAKTLYDAARQQMEYAVLQAAYQETNGDKKIADMEKFVEEFPDSPQICSAYSIMAVTYQQKRDVARSAENAEKCIKADPNDLDMRVFLADLQIEDRTKVKETAELIRRAVELADALESKPVPEGQSEADWTRRKNYLRGTAHGLRGYQDMKSAQYAKALPDLEIAYKLLGEDPAILYRLGFALAKLRRDSEAENYLTRAAKMPGPFQQAARKALSELRR